MTKEEIIAQSKKILALLKDGEHEAIYDLAVKHIPQNGCAIEIGSWEGGSAVIIGLVCKEKNAKLICIDPFSDNLHHYGTLNENRLAKFKENTSDLPIEILIGSSFDMHSSIENESADFIFIDADHQYDAVKKDIINYKKKLKSHGVLLGHDYVSTQQGFEIQPVKDAVDELLGIDNIKVINTIWVLEK